MESVLFQSVESLSRETIVIISGLVTQRDVCGFIIIIFFFAVTVHYTLRRGICLRYVQRVVLSILRYMGDCFVFFVSLSCVDEPLNWQISTWIIILLLSCSLINGRYIRKEQVNRVPRIHDRLYTATVKSVNKKQFCMNHDIL